MSTTVMLSECSQSMYVARFFFLETFVMRLHS